MRNLSRPRGFPRHALFRAAIGLAAAACVVAPAVARADDAATAQALFDEAMELKAKEQWESACPKFESSYKLDPTLGTLLNLANCFEKVGKTASAWARWEEAFQKLSKKEDSRAEYAKTQRDALAPQLPRLKIIAQTSATTLTVERDTQKITDTMFGSALPVDPGEHTIFVKRDDDLLKTEKVKVAAAQTVEVKLDLAAIEKAAPPRKPKGSVVVVGVSPAMRTAGWAVGAAGLAGVVAAGVLETIALAKRADADGPGSCVDKLCTPAGKALANEAATFAEAGQWVGIGGIVVAAVGVTLLIVSPSKVTVNDGDAPKKDASAVGPDGAASGPKPRRSASALRNVWATPWIAPEFGGSGEAPRIGAGLVVGGHL